MIKIKNFIFNIFSILIPLIPISLYIYLSSKLLQINNNIIIYCVLILLLAIVTYLITFVVLNIIDENLFGDKNKISILGFKYFFLHRTCKKIVYHSELGEFICYLNKKENKMYIYKQNYFTLHEIDYLFIDGETITSISNRIKLSLDSKYNDMLNNKKREEIKSKKRTEIKNWDGFLDLPTKRNSILNKILK